MTPAGGSGSTVLTSGGGSGMVWHRMVSRMNFPRWVGDPSSWFAYSDRNPAVVSSPARRPSAGSATAVSDVEESPVVGSP